MILLDLRRGPARHRRLHLLPQGRPQASHALVAVLFRFYLASTAIAPSIKAARAWRASSAESSSDAPLPRPTSARTHFQEAAGPGGPSPHSQQRRRTARPEPGAGPRRRPTAPPDVLQPLITIARGLRRLAAPRGADGPRPPRTGAARCCTLVAPVVLVVALVPYGPLLAVIALMAAAVPGRAGTAPRRSRTAPTTPRPSASSRSTRRSSRTSPRRGPRSPCTPTGARGEGVPRVRVRRQRPLRPPGDPATPPTSPTGRPRPAPGSSTCSPPGPGGAGSTASRGRGGQPPRRRRIAALPTDIAAQRFVTAPGGPSSASPTDRGPAHPPAHPRRGAARRAPGRLAYRRPLDRAPPAGPGAARHRHVHPAALGRAAGPAPRRPADRRRRRHRRVRLPGRPGRRPGRRVRPHRSADQPGVGRLRDGTPAGSPSTGPVRRAGLTRRHQAAAVGRHGPAERVPAPGRRDGRKDLSPRPRSPCGTAAPRM